MGNSIHRRLEGFNVVDIITADRVVAQVSTEHPMVEGHVPTVTFLGSRSRISASVEFPSRSNSISKSAAPSRKATRPISKTLTSSIASSANSNTPPTPKGLPETLEKQYDAKIDYIDDLKRRANGDPKLPRNGYPKLQCSLIKRIGPIPIPASELRERHLHPELRHSSPGRTRSWHWPSHGNGFSHEQDDPSGKPSFSRMLQGEHVRPVARLSGGIVLLVREAVAMAGSNANFEFGQATVPKFGMKMTFPKVRTPGIGMGPMRLMSEHCSLG